MFKHFFLASICLLSAGLLPMSAEPLESSLPAKGNTGATMTVRTDQPGSNISRHIYGHFSEHLGHCIYGGIWVGPDSDIPNVDGYRTDVMEALKEMKIPNLRWPGGCFADEYHWRDGIGPRSSRPKMINTHWGGVVEDNSFGTHEFLNYCELIGAEPYICGNVGSGTVEEMSKWVEYITFDGESPMANLRRENGRDKPWKVKFWGVGNENWGCGGNMTAEFYTDQYRRYATYCRNYGDNRLQKIAGGPNGGDTHWTDVLMRNAKGQMWGLSMHYYTVPNSWNHKGSATDFSEEEYIRTMQNGLHMEDLIKGHEEVMDKYDPGKRVSLCVDEWGAWYDVEPGTNPGFLYQQNTLRDALLCASTLHIFQHHSDRVRMANIAQMVNVLQSVILTQDNQMVLTPTYHVYRMFNVHQDATNLPVEIDAPVYTCGTMSVPAVNAAASVDSEGAIHLSLVNVDPHQNIEISCQLTDVKNGAKVTAEILTSKKLNDFNTFGDAEKVVPTELKGVKLSRKGELTLTAPAKSVIMLTIK